MSLFHAASGLTMTLIIWMLVSRKFLAQEIDRSLMTSTNHLYDEDGELIVAKHVPTYYANETAQFHKYVTCKHDEIDVGASRNPSCLVSDPSRCLRTVADNLFTHDDIIQLKKIAEKGMATRESVGGPTILDINTGYIRDTAGLENLFIKPNDIFTPEDFAHYGRIINRLKDIIQATFGISNLYFTAPTFITRLDGREDWQAKKIHDEYWHPHADMLNTPHYHYSGLLYLSSYNEDFTGGRFIFTSNSTDRQDWEQVIEPYQGRTVFFTSGSENTHYVERVTNGQRLVLAFWFTCNVERQFEVFLDGQQHTTFSHRVRMADENRKKNGDKEKTRRVNAKFTNPNIPKRRIKRPDEL